MKSEKCFKCNKNQVSNKHFKLCIFCNKDRLDENKKASGTSVKYGSGIKRARKTKTSINKRRKSKEEEKSNFREKIKSEREAVCTGCNSKSQLTISHTIPVSLRKDLECDPNNIHIECLSCHTIWEHDSLEEKRKLFSFNDKINYIKVVDFQYFLRKFNE
jgi:5-methylcytosine-specific restriction endonuclease McrA